MPGPMPRIAVLTASLVIVSVAGSAATTSATASAAATVTPPAMAVHAAADPAVRPVFLVTGELVSAATTGRTGVSVMTGGPGQDTRSAGPLQVVKQGGTTEVIPVTAAPYVGRGPELAAAGLPSSGLWHRAGSMR